jgi:hypothetical protein
MRVFMIIAATFACLFGAALLLAPAQFYAPTGIAFTPMIATVAQAHGATLVGMGVVLWLARHADRQGLIAVLGGNLVVQILSLFVVVRTMRLGAGTAVAPGIVIHVILGSFFAFFLIRAIGRGGSL